MKKHICWSVIFMWMLLFMVGCLYRHTPIAHYVHVLSTILMIGVTLSNMLTSFKLSCILSEMGWKNIRNMIKDEQEEMGEEEYIPLMYKPIWFVFSPYNLKNKEIEVIKEKCRPLIKIMLFSLFAWVLVFLVS